MQFTAARIVTKKIMNISTDCSQSNEPPSPVSSKTKTTAEKRKKVMPSANARKMLRYSRASPSTALSIAPSGPRSARPGPSIPHHVAAPSAKMLRSIAIVVTSRKSTACQSPWCAMPVADVTVAYAKPDMTPACVAMLRKFCT